MILLQQRSRDPRLASIARRNCTTTTAALHRLLLLSLLLPYPTVVADSLATGGGWYGGPRAALFDTIGLDKNGHRQEKSIDPSVSGGGFERKNSVLSKDVLSSAPSSIFSTASLPDGNSTDDRGTVRAVAVGKTSPSTNTPSPTPSSPEYGSAGDLVLQDPEQLAELSNPNWARTHLPFEPDSEFPGGYFVDKPLESGWEKQKNPNYAIYRGHVYGTTDDWDTAVIHVWREFPAGMSPSPPAAGVVGGRGLTLIDGEDQDHHDPTDNVRTPVPTNVDCDYLHPMVADSLRNTEDLRYPEMAPYCVPLLTAGRVRYAGGYFSYSAWQFFTRAPRFAPNFHPRESFQSWNDPSIEFHFDRFLGRGTYGEAYLGQMTRMDGVASPSVYLQSPAVGGPASGDDSGKRGAVEKEQVQRAKRLLGLRGVADESLGEEKVNSAWEQLEEKTGHATIPGAAVPPEGEQLLQELSHARDVLLAFCRRSRNENSFARELAAQQAAGQSDAMSAPEEPPFQKSGAIALTRHLAALEDSSGGGGGANIVIKVLSKNPKQACPGGKYGQGGVKCPPPVQLGTSSAKAEKDACAMAQELFAKVPKTTRFVECLENYGWLVHSPSNRALEYSVWE